jgi:CubicO group peptidase (beta-lactamase class C family)/pimeloyl-ACP methyl ester carboxylesterase
LFLSLVKESFAVHGSQKQNQMQITRSVVPAATLSLILAAPFCVAAPEQPHVTSEQVTRAVQELEKLAQQKIEENAVPGLAIAVVFQDKVVYAKGFGVRDVNTKARVDADTVFQLASVSKPIGSTVVAELVGEGKINWDSKLNALDPTFEMFDPWVTREITVRDMYAHRSGLPDHAGDLLEDLGFTRAEILFRLRYQRPDSSFRSHYAYTNFGMTEGAVAAAKAYGQEWEALCHEKLYKPLGMTSTSSRYVDFVARKNKALGRVLVNGKWEQKFKRDPDAQSPTGGVSSSVNDVAKWIRLQLANGKFDGKQIVSEKPLAETHHPHMLTGYNPFTNMPTFYGLGWNVSYDQQGRLRLNHSGGFDLGAATFANLVPAEQLGIIVLTNGRPVGIAEALGTIFLDIALYGKPTQDWFPLYKQRFADPATTGTVAGFDYSKPPASPAPALKNTAYLGKYANDFFGEIAVIEKDGGLAIVQGPKNMTFAMKHYDRDTFTYDTIGENAVGRTGITFTIGPDGEATQVVVENLNVRGEGTFKRVSTSERTSQSTAPAPVLGNFADLIDIGAGRKIYLECRGSGSPTVILESGYRNDADIWSAQLEAGMSPVFSQVARFTRVCAYDRPGTFLDPDHLGRSTPAPMPRTASDLVSDLHALLQTARVPGPYVFAAHSFGGIFARLYASTYPNEVVGMVLVDALSEKARTGLTPEQWKLYVDFGFTKPTPGLEKYKDIETLDVNASLDQMEKADAAEPLRPMPLFVLTQGQPFDLSPWQPLPADFPGTLNKAWHAAQDALATLAPNAKHKIATKSSHYIQVQEPQLVIDAIKQVVEAVRNPDWVWLPDQAKRRML